METKDSSEIIKITQDYISEAKFARQSRMDQNQLNFDVYHMRQDYTHKLPGQSKEFVGKQSMAVEQITSFIQQGLLDSGEWFGIELQKGIKSDDSPISADEAKSILQADLESCDFLSTIGDSVKLGLLQSLMIAKPHGEIKNRSIFYTEQKQKPDGTYKDILKRADKPYWTPKVDLLRAEDYYPDPTGRGLYKIQELYMDLHDVIALTKSVDGEDPVYMASAIDTLSGGYGSAGDDQDAKKSTETGQNSNIVSARRRVKIHECWGTIVNSVGEVLHKDVTWTIADNKILLSAPKPFPLWHGAIPYITAPFIRVPHSEWHKALMDGPTRLNIAQNELFNLMVDDGMNSVHGIKQIRTDWLEDESQISNGVYPGITLKVNSQAPMGGKVMEVVSTAGMSPETMNIYQLINSEFSSMALTNDLRMGVMPNRAVKATEVVEASQSITGVMTGIAKVIEANYVEPILYQMWANRLQHMDLTYRPDLVSLIGEERADAILAMTKEDLFAKCVDGFKFKVFGVSRVLAKQKDFKKITALIQTLASDPPLMEEFMKEYSTPALLAEFLRSLDISVDRIKLSREDKQAQQAQQEAAMQAQQGAGAGPGTQPGQGPDMQSQIPQASAQGSADTVESTIPRADLTGLNNKAAGGTH